MKKMGLMIATLFALLAGSMAQALTPYAVHQDIVNSTGSQFMGWYFIPPDHSGQYLWLYDGTVNVDTGNPLKEIAIGSGLYYDGTSLSAQPLSRVFNYPTRALNTCFQPSATQDAQVSYAVDIATSISLTGGSQGTVYLRSYTNSSCSAGAHDVQRSTTGQSGTLTVGLTLTQTGTATLSGIIPAGAYAQLVTESNSGTPTFTYRSAQEVLL